MRYASAFPSVLPTVGSDLQSQICPSCSAGESTVLSIERERERPKEANQLKRPEDRLSKARMVLSGDIVANAVVYNGPFAESSSLLDCTWKRSSILQERIRRLLRSKRHLLFYTESRMLKSDLHQLSDRRKELKREKCDQSGRSMWAQDRATCPFEDIEVSTGAYG